METAKQMDSADILFLASENEQIYYHTAGVVVVDPGSSKFSFERFRKRCIDRLQQVPQFSWKLHEVPFDLDLPYWVEDENFNWNNHFKRIAVPSPGDRDALGKVVSYLYSRHLDRNRPLWEIWYIEGLPEGKVAIMQKTHHCLMDGQGMQKLGELLADFSPRGKARPVGAEISDATPGALPDQRQVWENALLHWLGFPYQLSRRLATMAGPIISKRLQQKNPKEKTPGPPLVFFNTDISAERGFVFGSLPIADIRQVKNAFGVTVNDVVMALVGGSLRNYLLNYEELPADSLFGNMPVSLRSEDNDGLGGNKVTTTPVSLATDIEDPVERLRAISDASGVAKRTARGGGIGFGEVVQTLPPVLMHAVMTHANPEQVPAIMGANVVISNVRGSPKPMYVAGARMESMFPVSILTPGMGLNVTCVSYCDRVDFGLTLAPELFTEPWAMIDGLDQALAQYLKLAAQQAPDGS